MAKSGKKSNQLPMRGMTLAEFVTPTPHLDSRELRPGRAVRYVGKIRGGPRYGTRGVVKRTFARRALVELSGFGSWTIPYYFLGPNGLVAEQANRDKTSKTPVTQ